MFRILVCFGAVVALFQANCFNLAGFFESTENELNQKAFELAIKSRGGEENLLMAVTMEMPIQEPFTAINITCNLLQDGVLAIFGPKSLSNINAVQSVCDEKELPHILSRWIYYPLRPGTAVNFYPSAPLLTEAYWAIILAWKWKTFTVLYEDDESLLRVSELILRAKQAGIVATVEQLDRDGTGNYREALKQVWKTKQRFIVIDCHINNLIEVLVQCQQVGMMTSDYSYFLTNLDAHTKDLSPFQWSQTNITGIRIVNPESVAVQEISQQLFPDVDPMNELVETASLLQTETALVFDAVNMFSETLHKMTMFEPPGPLDCKQTADGWPLGYTLVNLLRTSSYKGLTGTIEFNNEGHRSTFDLQVYEIREGGIINIATFNSTKQELKIMRNEDHTSSNVTGDMRNQTFTVIISLTEPYGMLKETSENLQGNEMYEGFSIDLIHELSLLEGFNYSFIVQLDGSNGNKVNNHWTGMIGAVIDGSCSANVVEAGTYEHF